MKNRLKYLVTLVALLYGADGLAFGQSGHRIVCQMAYEMLSPVTQIQVNGLMSAVPPKHVALVNRYQRATDKSEISFASGCVWPDAVKRDKAYDGTYEWHYINVQRSDERVELDDCMVGCLLSAIDHHSGMLESELPAWPRAQALMFLAHWVADLHQPMHVGFADDRGGNDTLVIVPDSRKKVRRKSGNCSNMHVIWDFCILESRHLAEKEIVRTLGAGIGSRQVSEWEEGGALDWANESLALSRDPDVSYCTVTGDRCNAFPLKDGKPRVLAPDYYRQQWPVVSERMQQASVRLAFVLTKLLDPS